MAAPLLERLAEDLRRRPLWPPHSPLLVATSGGADSTALLLILHAMGLDLLAGLVDHGHRDLSREREFLRSICDARGIPFVCREASCARQDEASLRRARHGALAELATRHGYSYLALAHTEDDQAETIFMRILRGTSLRGLGGIPRSRPGFPDDGTAPAISVVRPLLGLPRAEVRAWLEDLGIVPVEDPTNRDPSYLRNRVRLDLLPALRHINPRISEALLRLSETAAEAHAFLEREASDLEAKAKLQDGNAPHGIDGSILIAAPRVLRLEVIRSWIRALPGRRGEISRVHIEAVERLLRLPGNAEASLPGGLRVRKQAGWLIPSGIPKLPVSPGIGARSTLEHADLLSL